MYFSRLCAAYVFTCIVPTNVRERIEKLFRFEVRFIRNTFNFLHIFHFLLIYLPLRAYSAASEEDLFAALQSAVEEDSFQLPTSFANIMSSWTRQKGFPIVTVERNYESSTVTLNQQRYVSGEASTQDPARWWIPFNLASASSANFDETTATHWLPATTGTQTITVANLNASDWLLVNKKVRLGCIPFVIELVTVTFSFVFNFRKPDTIESNTILGIMN